MAAVVPRAIPGTERVNERDTEKESRDGRAGHHWNREIPMSTPQQIAEGAESPLRPLRSSVSFEHELNLIKDVPYEFCVQVAQPKQRLFAD